MKARHLHDWQMNPSQAKEIQARLAGQIIREPEFGDVSIIAGVDISAPNAECYARAAAVVLTYPALELIETRVVERKVTFPYVPGLLSFRESPLIIAACEELDAEPDLIMVDGQGIAHPRRFGLASHLGLLWDKPTIGCAKSRLCGHHDIVPQHPGAHTELIDDEEVIGAALCTKPGVSPLYISIGHRIDLQSAIDWVLRCCRGLRIPEPTRQAHPAAGKKTEKLTGTGRRKDLQLPLLGDL